MEGTALLVGAIVMIIVMTLTPSWGGATGACLICGPEAGADAILNIALFLPVGAAFALLGANWRTALAVSAGISVAIELLQLTLPIGRVASISDPIANVAGALVGLYGTRRRRAILYPRSRSAVRYAIVGASAWLVLLAVTALLLRPSLPEGRYYGQWEPVLDAADARAGRVVSATAAGLPVPEGAYADSEAIRSALRERMQLDVRAQFTAAGPERLAGIVRIVSDTEGEILLVARRGQDIVFRSRTLATEMRLITPAVTMAEALGRLDFAQPRLVPIDGRREDGTLRLMVYGREATLGLHAGLGWMFLVPSGNPLGEVPDLASALWVGLPLFLIAYWTGRRARRKARRAGDAFRMTGTGGQVVAALPVLAGLVIVGLAGISLLFGLSVPDGSVWAGAVVALALGILSGISTALSHDDRAHGLSSAASGTSSLAEPAAVSGAFGVLKQPRGDGL